MIKKVKLLVVGDGGVGKTTLVKKFIRVRQGENVAKFANNEVKPTVGLEVETVDLEEVRVIIWDFSGQQRFKETFPDRLLRGAKVAIVVFDVSRVKTLQSAGEWAERVKSVNNDIKFVLVGNKIDLGKKVPQEMIDNLVKRLNAAYVETSAKEGVNVVKPFEEALRWV